MIVHLVPHGLDCQLAIDPQSEETATLFSRLLRNERIRFTVSNLKHQMGQAAKKNACIIDVKLARLKLLQLSHTFFWIAWGCRRLHGRVGYCYRFREHEKGLC